MSQDSLNKFNDLLMPYRSLWQSARITTIAARNGDTWINLATRLEFTDQQPDPRDLYRNLDTVFAYDGDFPISEYGHLLHNIIVDGRIPLQTRGPQTNVHLTRPGLIPASQPFMNWFPPRDYPPDAAQTAFGKRRTTIALISSTNEHINDILTPDAKQDVDTKLRLTQPSFENLYTLADHLAPGLLTSDYNGSSTVQCIAPLPFTLNHNEEAGLTLDAPTKAFEQGLTVTIFFKPGTTTQQHTITAKAAQESTTLNHRTWQHEITWPAKARYATIFLHYNNKTIQQQDITRWPHARTIRVAVDNYFDPTRQHLDHALFKEKKQARVFEQGVVRLLNLLGIPFVWYGGQGIENRPDLAATIEDDTSTTPLVLLGECTIENPQQKFSSLLARTKELETIVRDEALIIPIVFTRAPAIEIDDARDYGIILSGETELKHLLSMLDNPPPPRDVLTFLRSTNNDAIGHWPNRLWQ